MSLVTWQDEEETRCLSVEGKRLEQETRTDTLTFLRRRLLSGGNSPRQGGGANEKAHRDTQDRVGCGA